MCGHAEARQAIVEMFADFAQADDLLTLRCALEAVGCEVEQTDDAMIGHRGSDEPLRFELAWFA